MRIASKSNLSNADEELRQELLDRLIDSRLLGPTMQLSMNHDPRRLPMKELPHGNWTNMFLMYQAYSRAAGETPASRSTFFSVITAWKACIKFHRRTHHQMCLTCSTLRSQIQGTSDSSHIISSSFWFPCQPLPCFNKNDVKTMRPITINFVRTLGCSLRYRTGCLCTTHRFGKTAKHITKLVNEPRAKTIYWWWFWTLLTNANSFYPVGVLAVPPSGRSMKRPIVTQLSSSIFMSICIQWPCFNHGTTDKILGSTVNLCR